MIHRQVVNVYNPTKATGKNVIEKSGATVVLPAVFSVGVRPDIVNFVHTNVSKNRRQGHAVNFNAGMKHSAASWGTGRAVARIPRVSGSGTSRNGQGAFGNMCRKGRMFAPIRIWRRWHRRSNIKQKRYAVSSALASSAILPLVQARGHRVDAVPEFPLVISDSVEKIERTKEAVKFLKDIGAYGDVQKVIDTVKVRAGKGKLRNRRFRSRRGPLVVYSGANVPLLKALRNIPGVEVAHVSRLNLLQLAPGGHVGRFIIWTESAFKELNNTFGTYKQAAASKKGWTLPSHEVTNPDIARVINSNEVQTAIRAAKTDGVVHYRQKHNPLTNQKASDVLTPIGKLARENATKLNKERCEARKKQFGQKRDAAGAKLNRERKNNSRKWISNVQGYITAITKKATDEHISNQKLERQIE